MRLVTFALVSDTEPEDRRPAGQPPRRTRADGFPPAGPDRPRRRPGDPPARPAPGANANRRARTREQPSTTRYRAPSGRSRLLRPPAGHTAPHPPPQGHAERVIAVLRRGPAAWAALHRTPVDFIHRAPTAGAALLRVPEDSTVLRPAPVGHIVPGGRTAPYPPPQGRAERVIAALRRGPAASIAPHPTPPDHATPHPAPQGNR
ncbi:hypothetical protein SHL15_3886 [Streptomyces hygroscopicus subsp. limoneus]|nr:hypothetical protein SHL15_3886 [Streptomyces hygroscopicus subsp. limoneus]